ncbi:MAG TPA: cobalamin biosynthesis protein CobD [Desulfotomaculum sp.]|nr:MAG: cobalamin biosynthesis protein [Desulfotomaculum sp. BICA1-6]HBX22475.1 cobalamin biosynthesis protein CobD [Desulfotomaculum sp.]
MEIFFWQALLGYIIDLLVGDPPRLPHPVVLIGNSIARLESVARKTFNSDAALKIAGVILAATVTVGSFAVTALLLYALREVSYLLFLLAGAWLVSTTIATKGLATAARDIKQLLAEGDLPGARRQVGMIVGRDTGDMDSGDVARATVETVAENFVDAVAAPLFYACLGGPALAMAYRAVNTLDSMLGYKNEKYMYLGWASARLDDLAGYVPARLAGGLLLFAAWLSNRDWRRAWRAWRRDAAVHPSPNSGIPESVMAGTLGIQLGGRNVYGGVVSHRAFMGEPGEEMRPDHINRAIDMLYLGALIAVLVVPVFWLAVWWGWTGLVP